MSWNFTSTVFFCVVMLQKVSLQVTFLIYHNYSFARIKANSVNTVDSHVFFNYMSVTDMADFKANSVNTVDSYV